MHFSRRELIIAVIFFLLSVFSVRGILLIDLALIKIGANPWIFIHLKSYIITMGVYIELIFCATLKKETPKEVLDTLLYMTGEAKRPEKMAFDMIINPLTGGDYQPANKMWHDAASHRWRINATGLFKVKGFDIEEFLQWIKPWVESGFGTRQIYAMVMHEDYNYPDIYALYDPEED